MTRPIMFVHGFQYDSSQRSRDNPDSHTYPRWEQMLGISGAQRHAWFSVPLSFKNVFRSWLHGRWNRYRWAWDLAEAESFKVATALRRQPAPVDVVCHSLGSRVVLLALELGAPAARVLILNGAEYAITAARVANKRDEIEFFSACVKTDDVLNKLGRFAPGWGGKFVGNGPLGASAPPNWTDLPLDDDDFRRRMKTVYDWDLAGDNPDESGDHWFSFEHEGNWPLYRAIMGRTWPE